MGLEHAIHGTPAAWLGDDQGHRVDRPGDRRVDRAAYRRHDPPCQSEMRREWSIVQDNTHRVSNAGELGVQGHELVRRFACAEPGNGGTTPATDLIETQRKSRDVDG